MSNQSGISASQDLLACFKSFKKNPEDRFLIIKIENENLVPGEKIQKKTNFVEDFDLFQNILKDDEPLYAIYKQDSGVTNTSADNNNEAFIFISYVPDNVPVRNKMLYASTRNTLLREIGSNSIDKSIFATEKRELTAKGYKEFEAHEKLEAPLTREEESLLNVKEKESDSARGTNYKVYLPSARSSTGVYFPLEQEAKDALKLMSTSTSNLNLIHLMIDLNNEIVKLNSSISNGKLSDIGPSISLQEGPRFTFFKDLSSGSIIFIYYCPSGSKVKDRMVYATSRSGILSQVKELGINPVKSIEESDPEALTEDLLIEYLPSKSNSSLESNNTSSTSTHNRFAKPRAPGRHPRTTPFSG